MGSYASRPANSLMDVCRQAKSKVRAVMSRACTMGVSERSNKCENKACWDVHNVSAQHYNDVVEVIKQDIYVPNKEDRYVCGEWSAGGE